MVSTLRLPQTSKRDPSRHASLGRTQRQTIALRWMGAHGQESHRPALRIRERASEQIPLDLRGSRLSPWVVVTIVTSPVVEKMAKLTAHRTKAPKSIS